MITMYIKDGKILPKNKIVIISKERQIINPSVEMLTDDGWVEYISPEPTETDSLRSNADYFREKLSKSDYKVIKCMESFLCGEDLPYDITELHRERQALRDKVNEYNQTNGEQ